MNVPVTVRMSIADGSNGSARLEVRTRDVLSGLFQLIPAVKLLFVSRLLSSTLIAQNYRSTRRKK